MRPESGSYLSKKQKKIPQNTTQSPSELVCGASPSKLLHPNSLSLKSHNYSVLKSPNPGT